MIAVVFLIFVAVVFASSFFVFKQVKNSFSKINLENTALKEEKDRIKDELNKEKDELNKELNGKNIEIAKLLGELQSLKDNRKNQEELEKQMQVIFQNISNSTLEKQTEIGKQKIDEMLKPFKEDIKNCKTALDEVNLKTKTEIKSEISKMIEGTKNLGQSAEELAKAFRGENKIQGNWGEKQVEELLNNSGLEGLYEKQYTFNYKGTIYRPDFIIKLPDGKRFILDSKVSTENYIKYFNATDEKEKENQIKLHINSIKKHIDELKKYQDSYKEYIKTIQEEQLETLDFIVMFIAPENAYVEAVLHSKQEILKYAYDNKVAIVTASSLMPVLRMISHLWNIEKSNKNISEIVDKVVLLHDKLSKFAQKTNETHKHLMDAVTAHEQATNYLANGNNNVLKTAERIKTLMGNKITTDISLFIEENKTDNDAE